MGILVCGPALVLLGTLVGIIVILVGTNDSSTECW
jgi:hypothetical protein